MHGFLGLQEIDLLGLAHKSLGFLRRFPMIRQSVNKFVIQGCLGSPVIPASKRLFHGTYGFRLIHRSHTRATRLAFGFPAPRVLSPGSVNKSPAFTRFPIASNRWHPMSYIVPHRIHRPMTTYLNMNKENKRRRRRSPREWEHPHQPVSEILTRQ